MKNVPMDPLFSHHASASLSPYITPTFLLQEWSFPNMRKLWTSFYGLEILFVPGIGYKITTSLSSSCFHCWVREEGRFVFWWRKYGQKDMRWTALYSFPFLPCCALARPLKDILHQRINF
jgi:hypothetical protein